MENTQTIRPVFNLLHITFGLVPIVAGLDKFTNLLTDWEKYLAPEMTGMLPFSPSTFMMVVGVIEIIAGIIVFLKPAIGGYIVAAWLVLIAINLMVGAYFDIAVRDLVMAIAAFSMAKLSLVVKNNNA